MSESLPPQRNSNRWILYVIVVVAVGLLLAAVIARRTGSGELPKEPRKVVKIALVPAAGGTFWDLAIQGAKDAGAGYDAEVTVFTPSGDKAWQNSAFEELQNKKFDGVAVSPNDPASQSSVLAKIASTTNMVTIDSDAQGSNRLCFIGIDNYGVGRTCAKYITQAIPGGGEVVLAVGSLDKENGRLRRQGIIDELLGRPFDRNAKSDPADVALKGDKYSIVTTLVDGFDHDKAEQMAGEAIAKYPNVKCMVGLFSYNTPAILKALEKAGKVDKIQVVGFDADDVTLKNIEDGHVFATMVQDPYVFGAEAVRLLADASRGENKFVPQSRQRLLGCDPVTKSDMPRFRAERADKLGDPQAPQTVSPAGKT